jgi:hypothetical protein
MEDSWEPDDDMRLMKSAFGHRYMIMSGWGTNLFPRNCHGRTLRTRKKDLRTRRRFSWRITRAGAEGAGTKGVEKTGTGLF